MIRGSLGTMPLADLLQWVDAARKDVVIEVAREGGLGTWLRAKEREVVSCAMPYMTGSLCGDGSSRAPGLRATAVEGLLDLFFVTEAEFTLRDASTGVPRGGVTVAVPLGFLVMEGLRQLDEWPRIASAYADEHALVRSRAPEGTAELSTVQRAILDVAKRPTSLGELAVVLGLSRHALLRRLDELHAIGLLEIEGVGPRSLPRTLAEQAQGLLREGQYAEAAHVLRSLLSASPGDATLTKLLAETERQHIRECYAHLPHAARVRLTDARPAASSTEQALVEILAQKPRSVAALVLVSPLRELETLASLRRMLRRGLVTLETDG